MSEPVTTQEATHLAPAPKRRRWLMWALLVVVFLSGVVCGAGLMLSHVLRQTQAAVRSPELRAEQGTRWLSRRLDLTADQKSKVHRILQDQAHAMARLRQEILPEAQAQFDQTEKDISAVLTPKQQKKWHETASDLRRRWAPAGAQEPDQARPPRRERERERPAPTTPDAAQD